VHQREANHQLTVSLAPTATARAKIKPGYGKTEDNGKYPKACLHTTAWWLQRGGAAAGRQKNPITAAPAPSATQTGQGPKAPS